VAKKKKGNLPSARKASKKKLSNQSGCEYSEKLNERKNRAKVWSKTTKKVKSMGEDAFGRRGRSIWKLGKGSAHKVDEKEMDRLRRRMRESPNVKKPTSITKPVL